MKDEDREEQPGSVATPPGAAPGKVGQAPKLPVGAPILGAGGRSRAATLDRSRYLQVVWFFGSAFLSFIWWELILRHIPGIGGIAVRSSLERWCKAARRFRKLAIRMGGVLIKLGQFLSIRVDVLPPEITAELAGLQDEVPAERYEDIAAVITAEFGVPPQRVFAWFSPEPLAAASLAQVHRARLPAGNEVVVKVQRPRIETLVETDLAAIRIAANWLKWYRPLARRVDLDRLFDEFARTTRAEMDFVAEGKNAERFAANFSGDRGIYLADVYWEYTTSRVLTLENVASLKITDLEAIEAAGIRRAAVAKRLFQAYLKQIFVHNFVHADPHPGNLFVHPLPRGSEGAVGSSEDGGRPFLLIFVDFGMVAVIPQQLRASLREYLIGIGARDSHRVVQSYIDAGVLRPGVDRKRIEEVHDVLFQALEGVRMGTLGNVAFEQAEMLVKEYRDLLRDVPFQFPSEMLFAVRAVGILAGIATKLDPEFDPWAATIPFAKRVAAEDSTLGWRGWLDEAGGLARLALRLPHQLDQVLTQAQRGDLAVQTSLAPDAAKALRRVERSVDRLAWSVITVGLLLAGVWLRTVEGPGGLSTGLLVAASLSFIWGFSRR